MYIKQYIIILICFVFVMQIPISMVNAEQKLSIGCRIDLDYTTQSYESSFSSMDIESQVLYNKGDMIYVTVVAQGVKKLDTYQFEIQYNPEKLEFIDGYEDSQLQGVQNLLKAKGGSTIGFQAMEKESGLINVANAMIGNDSEKAADGSGCIGMLKFQVLSDQSTELYLSNVHFVDASQKEVVITNLTGGHIN